MAIYVTKADKCNTVVILNNDVYNVKVDRFIADNNIKLQKADPTDEFVGSLNSEIDKCTHCKRSYTDC